MYIEIEWENERFIYDTDRILLEDAFVIKAHTGMGLRSWDRAFADIDPIAVQAVAWEMFQQNGRPMPIASVKVNPLPFVEAFTAGAAKAIVEIEKAKAAKKADPTGTASRKRGGTTRKRTPTSAN